MMGALARCSQTRLHPGVARIEYTDRAHHRSMPNGEHPLGRSSGRSSEPDGGHTLSRAAGYRKLARYVKPDAAADGGGRSAFPESWLAQPPSSRRC